MKVRDIVKLIEADGWRMVSQKGSHRQYKHPNKRGCVTVPGHPGDDLPPGLEKSIRQQAQLNKRRSEQ
jgi:predicted RNA binding protein YcfA (HicA-like mRNA interferase family)